MEAVHAIKKKEQVAEVGTLLKHYGSQLYLDLWNVGINLSLRISELLNMKYEDIDTENRRYILKKHETKSKKSKEVRLNERVITIVESRKKKYPSDIYLFQTHSNASRGKPPSRQYVGKLFKDVGERMGVRLGTHSMRKTRGYFMYKNGVSLEMISKVLGHSSTATTLAYIGIEKENVLDTYDEFVL